MVRTRMYGGTLHYTFNMVGFQRERAGDRMEQETQNSLTLKSSMAKVLVHVESKVNVVHHVRVAIKIFIVSITLCF